MVPSVSETIASVPQEGEKIAETVVPDAQREIVTDKTLTKKDGLFTKVKKTGKKVAPSAKEKEEKKVVLPVDKELSSLYEVALSVKK